MKEKQKEVYWVFYTEEIQQADKKFYLQAEICGQGCLCWVLPRYWSQARLVAAADLLPLTGQHNLHIIAGRALTW